MLALSAHYVSMSHLLFFKPATELVAAVFLFLRATVSLSHAVFICIFPTLFYAYEAEQS